VQDLDQHRRAFLARHSIAKNKKPVWNELHDVLFDAMIDRLPPREDPDPEAPLFPDFKGDNLRTAITRACRPALRLDRFGSDKRVMYVRSAVAAHLMLPRSSAVHVILDPDRRSANRASSSLRALGWSRREARGAAQSRMNQWILRRCGGGGKPAATNP
jgi:hypothetical protein